MGTRHARRPPGCGCAYCRASHFLERIIERSTVLDHVADPLQHDEGRMPFVEMPGGRHQAQGFQEPDPPDAEDDLLLNAGFTIAAIETSRELPVPGRVSSRSVSSSLHASKADQPHRDQDDPVAERHCDDAGLSVRGDGAIDRRVGPVQMLFTIPAAILRTR